MFAEGKLSCTLCLKTIAKRREKARRSVQDPAGNTKLCTTCVTQRTLEDFASGLATCRRCLNRTANQKRKGSDSNPAPGQARCSSCRKEKPQENFAQGHKTCSKCLAQKRAKRGIHLSKTEPQREKIEEQAALLHENGVDLEAGMMHTIDKEASASTIDRPDHSKPCCGTTESFYDLAIDDVATELMEWLQQTVEEDTNEGASREGGSAGGMTSSGSKSGSGWSSACACHLSCSSRGDDDQVMVLTLYDGEVPRMSIEFMAARWPWFLFALILNSYWVFLVPNVAILREAHWSNLIRIIISALCWLASWCIAGFIIGRNVTYACIERREGKSGGGGAQTNPGGLLFY